MNASLSEDETLDTAAYARGPVGRVIAKLVTFWSLAGAAVFFAMVAMSIASIVGRKLFNAPIQGDVELLQMGAAIASSSFFALCEFEDHHIKVDALTTWMSPCGRARLDLLAHTLLGVVAALLAWRTSHYVLEVRENMEVSTLLQVPLWWPVLVMVPGFVLLGVAAAYRMALCSQSGFVTQENPT
jgi:TRAP-type C4-dicarboxylate transport system permease small subunit